MQGGKKGKKGTIAEKNQILDKEANKERYQLRKCTCKFIISSVNNKYANQFSLDKPFHNNWYQSTH